MKVSEVLGRPSNREKTEAELQDDIRNALAKIPGCMIFRANVLGEAWCGKVVNRGHGTVVIDGARRVTSGLPAGFADLFGLYQGRFVAIEVKSRRGVVSTAQQRFIASVQANGGLAGVARSVEDAMKIIGVTND
jgi:hypothetical protein